MLLKLVGNHLTGTMNMTNIIVEPLVKEVVKIIIQRTR